MLVGDKRRFAIEFSVQEPRLDNWLFGKICYRLGDQIIGDYELGGALNGGVGALIELLKNKGRRREDQLIKMHAEAIYNILNYALYTDSGQSMEQIKIDREYFWRFHAEPFGFDVFDGWKCYLIEDDKVGRFLWKDLRSEARNHVCEQILEFGEFDHVLTKFVEYMNETYQECGGREEFQRLLSRSTN